MTRTTRIRLVVFLLIGAVAVINAGVRYAGLGAYVAPHSIDVTVHLARSGGLFDRAEVTWRGVTVGRVRSLEFDRDGVVATIAIDRRWHIPSAGLRAEVHNRSAVGEQYLDLVPASDDGPYLGDGAVIAASATTTPVPDEQVILALHRLLTSVDPHDLQTVVTEAGKAFDGAGGDIARLLDNAGTILRAARSALPDTTSLLRTGAVVLRTQDAQSGTISAYLRDLEHITAVLAAHRADIRTVLRDGASAVDQLGLLARGLTPALRTLLGRLVTLTRLTSTRLAKLEETLVALPWALASAQTPGRDGLAHFTFVGAQDPAPCQRGYLPPSRWRSPLDDRHSDVPDSIGCAEDGAVPRGADSVHPR